MISIPAGSLNKRVTIMAPNTAKDETGDPVGDVPLKQTYAQIRPMSGSEAYRAQQFTDKANITVVIRYDSRVRANMTVAYQDRTFQIHAVLNEGEENVYMILLSEEINP